MNAGRQCRRDPYARPRCGERLFDPRTRSIAADLHHGAAVGSGGEAPAQRGALRGHRQRRERRHRPRRSGRRAPAPLREKTLVAHESAAGSIARGGAVDGSLARRPRAARRHGGVAHAAPAAIVKARVAHASARARSANRSPVQHIRAGHTAAPAVRAVDLRVDALSHARRHRRDAAGVRDAVVMGDRRFLRCGVRGCDGVRGRGRVCGSDGVRGRDGVREGDGVSGGDGVRGRDGVRRGVLCVERFGRR